MSNVFQLKAGKRSSLCSRALLVLNFPTKNVFSVQCAMHLQVLLNLLFGQGHQCAVVVFLGETECFENVLHDMSS